MTKEPKGKKTLGERVKLWFDTQADFRGMTRPQMLERLGWKDDNFRRMFSRRVDIKASELVALAKVLSLPLETILEQIEHPMPEATVPVIGEAKGDGTVRMYREPRLAPIAGRLDAGARAVETLDAIGELPPAVLYFAPLGPVNSALPLAYLETAQGPMLGKLKAETPRGWIVRNLGGVELAPVRVTAAAPIEWVRIK